MSVYLGYGTISYLKNRILVSLIGYITVLNEYVEVDTEDGKKMIDKKRVVEMHIENSDGGIQ